MRRSLDIGFVALTDAAPLIVAHQRGFFAEEGLAVSLHREVSWATTRDKVAAGIYQGAHMLAPMAIAMSGGIGCERSGVVAPLSLNANSAALGVSARLAAEMADAANPRSPQAFAKAIARRRGPAVSFGVVFAFSLHTYMLRNWAAAAGLDPDRDMRIVITPPTAIAARLAAGEIDGFCVGAPWSALCEAEAGARIVLTAHEFWPGAPDKVLALSRSWAADEPDLALAVTRATLRASLWADAPENREDLTALLARPDHVDAPRDMILRGLTARPGAVAFARNAAAFPWRSHARWILEEMRRWGQIDGGDEAAALACYRPDLFRAAAASLGVSAPLADEKVEGAHDGDWSIPGALGAISLPRDTRFDGSVFDPER